MRRVALVTGASRGIGLAIARRLAARGDRVVCVARSPDEVVAALARDGVEPIALAADVGDAQSVEKAVARASAEGQLRTVVNCAGEILLGSVEHTAPDAWDRVLRTNLTGAFLVSRAAIPHLRAAGGGAIVNVSSVAGTLGAGYSAAYGAAKAGLVNFSQALAAELVPDRIRVSVISLGMVDTAMGREVTQSFSSVARLDADAFIAALQGRWIRPEEVAELAEWLTSDEAAAVSGAHVVADLGQTSRMT